MKFNLAHWWGCLQIPIEFGSPRWLILIHLGERSQILVKSRSFGRVSTNSCSFRLVMLTNYTVESSCSQFPAQSNPKMRVLTNSSSIQLTEESMLTNWCSLWEWIFYLVCQREGREQIWSEFVLEGGSSICLLLILQKSDCNIISCMYT